MQLLVKLRLHAYMLKLGRTIDLMAKMKFVTFFLSYFDKTELKQTVNSFLIIHIYLRLLAPDSIWYHWVFNLSLSTIIINLSVCAKVS